MRYSLALNWPVGAQDLAQDLVADRLRGLQLPAALAHRARLAQHVRERLARALARHLDQPELREAVHGDARAVARERLAELRQHRVAVLLRFHVDEVDDDDAAQVAQPQLARDRLGASRLVLKMVSSNERAETKPPVFTSIVVSASVWSTIT
jgi:hypothetical protein